MFRCTDCNKIYETKPDYCDCGNNTFIEDSPQVAPQPKTQTTQKTFLEQYPEIKNFLDSVDILSGIVFATCIILSIISWNVIGSWKPAQTPTQPTTQNTTTNQNQNVPDIDKLWDNTPPKSQMAETPTPILPKQPQPEPLVQPTKTPLPFMPAPKPVPKKVKPIPAAPKETPKPKKHATMINQELSSLSPDMRSYINGLRQALFSQWALGGISGVGLCEVEFSVSPSGKLINRRFSKQSDNDSLNSAVYHMLMNTPQYYPPPSEYNGEKIRISFYFSHGDYEVNFPKY
jgi:hypothetical protein